MILKSKNFSISLGNGDTLCLNDVYGKPAEYYPYGQIINGEDLEKGNIKLY